MGQRLSLDREKKVCFLPNKRGLTHLATSLTLYNRLGRRQTTAAAGAYTQFLGDVSHVLAAVAQGGGDLAVGDSVADTNVHNERNTK